MAIRPGGKGTGKGSGNGDEIDPADPNRKHRENGKKAAAVAKLGGDTSMHRQAPIGPHGMTPKQMKFFECLISGMNQSDAYREAYNTENMTDRSVQHAAHHTKMHPKVQSALMEWRHQCGQQMKFTVESLSTMAVETYETAYEGGNAGQMTGAILALAKLNGLVVERSERKIEQVGSGNNRAQMLAELNKLGKSLGITIIDGTATEVQPENTGGHDDGDEQG